MQKDDKFQLRISSELLDYCKANTDNISLFIREAVREKLESGKPLDSSLELIEIRAKTPFTYFAKLDRVIDGDTLLIEFDVGFFITLKEKIRLIGINAPEIDTPEGKKAKTFIEKELEDANLIVETRKKEKFGRYLAFVYYDKQYSDFEDIIRHGKLLNNGGACCQIRRVAPIKACSNQFAPVTLFVKKIGGNILQLEKDKKRSGGSEFC